MIQDLKRQMLNTELERYELKIKHYEHLYEQELAHFHEKFTGQSLRIKSVTSTN